MRNFEADKLVRIRDVIEIIESGRAQGNGTIEVDLGDAGCHTFNTDGSDIDLAAVENELLNVAERMEGENAY